MITLKEIPTKTSPFYKKSNLFDIFKFPFINKVNRYSQQRQ